MRVFCLVAARSSGIFGMFAKSLSPRVLATRGCFSTQAQGEAAAISKYSHGFIAAGATIPAPFGKCGEAGGATRSGFFATSRALGVGTDGPSGSNTASASPMSVARKVGRRNDACAHCHGQPLVTFWCSFWRRMLRLPDASTTKATHPRLYRRPFSRLMAWRYEVLMGNGPILAVF